MSGQVHPAAAVTGSGARTRAHKELMVTGSGLQRRRSHRPAFGEVLKLIMTAVTVAPAQQPLGERDVSGLLRDSQLQR